MIVSVEPASINCSFTPGNIVTKSRLLVLGWGFRGADKKMKSPNNTNTLPAITHLVENILYFYTFPNIRSTSELAVICFGLAGELKFY